MSKRGAKVDDVGYKKEIPSAGMAGIWQAAWTSDGRATRAREHTSKSPESDSL